MTKISLNLEEREIKILNDIITYMQSEINKAGYNIEITKTTAIKACIEEYYTKHLDR